MPKNYKWYVYAPLNEKRWAEIRKKENREEFKNALMRLSNIANKRLEKLEKTEWGKRSPAYKKWEEHGLGKFGKGNYDEYTELVKEYSRVTAFLRLKTTTEPAFQKFKTHIEELFNYKFENPENYDLFWDSFTRFENMNEDFEAVVYRGTAIAELADIFIKKDISTKEQGAELLTEWFEGLKGGVQKKYQSAPDVQEFNEMFKEDDGGFTF